MIKLNTLDGFEVKPWEPDFESDQAAQTWIWNQLMGETAKGDTLEFRIIARNDEQIFAGVLRDSEDNIKGIIPAMYSRFKDDTLDMVEWNGRTRHDVDDFKSDVVIGHIDVDMNEVGRKFLFLSR